jgi:hypothetical protein
VKTTVKLGNTPKEWDAQALYDKAQQYAERMILADEEDGENLLWSALAIELLARAALANVSPVLLVDARKEANLAYVFGFPVRESKFNPTSVSIEQVLTRLNNVVEGFIEQHREFCVIHMGYRNAELHSGDSPFGGVKNWEGPYYQAVEILLKSMGYDLKEFLGDEEGDTAQKQIDAYADKGAQAVKKDVENNKNAWLALSDADRAKGVAKSEVWATPEKGHREKCPACESVALVFGEPVGSPEREIDGDFITETQSMLPRKFECIACGLKISGLAKLTVVGLGAKFKNTQTFDGYELFAEDPDPYAGYEDDNNEPY